MADTSSHCWVCDDTGGLYVLRDSVLSKAKKQWIHVDSKFKTVSIGYDGLVCAIKNLSLYIRKSVTHTTPEGMDWVQHACDVFKVIPGKTCVVRKSAGGHLYVARVDYHAHVLDWESVPSLHPDSLGTRTVCHHVVDSADRLYSVTGHGEVFCCELLHGGDSGDLQWNMVVGPPPLRQEKGLLSWISSKVFWDTYEGRDWIRLVSFGADSLWCLGEGNELWQLAISWLNATAKAHWNRVNLPISSEEEVVAISACKSTRDGLYLMVSEEGHYKIVFHSFNASSRVDISLPVRYPCRSMGSCSLQAAPDVSDSGLGPSVVTRKRSASLRASKCVSSKGVSSNGVEGIPVAKRKKVRQNEDLCLISGVQIVYNQLLTTNQVDPFDSITSLEFPSVKDIDEKFQYDFSVEQDLIGSWK